MASIESDKVYMMPAHFGGRVPDGQPAIYDETRAVTVFYESDAAALQSLLPSGFELDRPEIMVSMMENRGVRWMGGEPYNIVAVNVAARWKKDELPGWFSLVVWENKTAPILSGREQTGVPKIFGEVEMIREYPDASARTWAHYGGHTFCEFCVENIVEADGEVAAMVQRDFGRMNWFGHRFIPKTNQCGGELSQAVLFPQEFEITRIRTGTPDLSWSPTPLHKNPTQAHIIATFASIPVQKYSRPAVLMDAKAVLRGDQAKVLGNID